MERMKLGIALLLLATDLSAPMVTAFQNTGYVTTMLTAPMMRITVHAMGSSAKITDTAFLTVMFAMDLWTALITLTKQTAPWRWSQPYLSKDIP
jgi:hypothetical protein